MAVIQPVPSGSEIVHREGAPVDFDNAVSRFESGFFCGETFTNFHHRKDGLAVFGHGRESERACIELVGAESAVGATKEMSAGFAIDAAEVNSAGLDEAVGGGELESEFFAKEL